MKIMIEIIKGHIEVHRVLESVQDPSAGGIDLFIGTTRDHADGKKVLSLEYEAYEPMALKLMNEISEQAKAMWGVSKISIIHRIGKIEIGEASVVIAVSSTHRKEAFEACRFIIDTIKSTVPIWKKEYFVGDERWVGMHQPE